MLLEVEESDIRGIINYLLRNKPSDLFLLDIENTLWGKGDLIKLNRMIK